MKKVILLIYFLVFLFSFRNQAQSFLSLDGVEEQNGNSVLIFRFGSIFTPDHTFNPVHSFNLTTGITTKIMNAYLTFTPWFDPAFKTVQDFEFRKQSSSSFMNIGVISPGTWYEYYIANNDLVVFEIEHNNILPRAFIDISKIDTSLVFCSDQTIVYRSFDGGYTFLEDSIINFPLISVSEFNNNIFFGIDNYNNLIKSENQGITFEVVDTAQIIIDSYFKFMYDINTINIYRTNKTFNKYALYVSIDSGNMSSWSMTYQSEKPLFVSLDSQLSGLIFLADGQQIYLSQNNGYNFLLYRELESEILGIYKKPSSDILYALSENFIYEISSDTVLIIADVTIVGVDNSERTNPNCIFLSQNYPNPFNPSTKIKYTIPAVGTRDRVSVQIIVFDVLGKEVVTLVNEEKPAGEYEVEFNGSELPSGIYFYQLKAGSFIETKKMILLK